MKRVEEKFVQDDTFKNPTFEVHLLTNQDKSILLSDWSIHCYVTLRVAFLNAPHYDGEEAVTPQCAYNITSIKVTEYDKIIIYI